MCPNISAFEIYAKLDKKKDIQVKAYINMKVHFFFYLQHKKRMIP